MSKSVAPEPIGARSRWIPPRAMAVKIAACYALLGGLWILGSGWLLHLFVQDPSVTALLETIKGWFFVLVTALLLGLALDRYFKEIRRSAYSDIAKHQQAEDELRQRLQLQDRIARIATTVPGMIYSFRMRPDGSLSMPYATAAIQQMCGLRPEDVREDFTPLLERVHPDDVGPLRESIAASARTMKPWQGAFRVRHPQKGELWFEGQSEPLLEPAGSILWHGYVQDVTERRHLESQLRQAQKLEAIGQLAGGVAHDFNNILAAIMMHLGLLQMNPRLDSETRHALQDLDEQARRAASLTRQLLMFSRRSVLAAQPLDLNEVVANLLKMLRRLIGENIDLRFDGKSGLPLVEADGGMMDQVLMNLTVNARDAMPKGGRITISTSLADARPGRAPANSDGLTGRFVCLEVSDTGCGMEAATLKRLFEPFFTTKEAGKGTGLGLATVHGIVAQHKGWVEVDSRVGQGSTFRVYLPASVQSPAIATPTPQSDYARRGRETILLVEDEMLVRRVTGQSLRALGYQVLEAGNGQEAMTLWQLHGVEVDLLLTDMVMPEGMTGLELTEQLQALKPGLKAILSSGYSAEIVNAGAPAKAGIVYLPKPFAITVLANVIRDCLEKKS